MNEPVQPRKRVTVIDLDGQEMHMTRQEMFALFDADDLRRARRERPKPLRVRLLLP